MNESAIGTARRDAHDHVSFCDGVGEAGLPVYAARGRVVARELLDALSALEAEHSARTGLQARCEVQQDLLGKHAYRATGPA